MVPALAAALALGGLAGAASRPGGAAVDLTGDWILNAAASQSLVSPSGPRDDAPSAGRPMPPEDSVLPDPPGRTDDADARRAPRPRAPSWLLQPERLEALRALLGETRSLSVVQTPTFVDLRGELTSRSLEIGAESQVSLPTGELADQKVRWQGDRLVIERRVPRGVKVVETYRRLAASDQLEVTVRRSGGPDDGLGKIELRRLFDRDRDDARPVPAAAAGTGDGAGAGPGAGQGAGPGPRAASSELAR
jgi:hypothetical protein